MNMNKRWKKGLYIGLALMIVLGMSTASFAETWPASNLVNYSASPVAVNQWESKTAKLGSYWSTEFREGETVEYYEIPRGERITVSAESGVSYVIHIDAFELDEEHGAYITDHTGLSMTRFLVKKDGTIVNQRMVSQTDEITLTGTVSFELPPDLSSLGYEDSNDSIFCVSIGANRMDDNDKTERDVKSFNYKTVDGAVVYPAMRFTDIPSEAWYYGDVNAACKLGLINGRTATTFVPNGNLTYAEAVKLAACMNQKYNDGKVTLENGSPNWYDSYVDYAKEKGIIDKDYDWNAPATRAGYVEIFAKALPEEAFAVKNEIADGAVPDVAADHAQATAIYTLYRAGILNGNDDKGTFKPDNSIRRCEVAAILTRMMDPDSRVVVTL